MEVWAENGVVGNTVTANWPWGIPNDQKQANDASCAVSLRDSLGNTVLIGGYLVVLDLSSAKPLDASGIRSGSRR